MTTDRDRLTALLDEWGVGYNGPVNQAAYYGDTEVAQTDVVLYSGDAKISGYGGFFAVFEFAEDGSFKQVAVWE